MTRAAPSAFPPRPRLGVVALALASAVVAPGCVEAIVGGGATPPTPLAFSLTTTDGRNVTHEDYRGRVLVVDMMATWCQPCKEAMPHLREFHAAHPEVALLSIDVDATEIEDDPLPAFKEKYRGEWAFAYDTDDVFARSGSRLIPTLVIVDAEGVVRERVTEYPLRADDLAARVATHAGGA